MKYMLDEAGRHRFNRETQEWELIEPTPVGAANDQPKDEQPPTPDDED